MIDLKKSQAVINELCEKHHVSHLYLFGSASRDSLAPDSDIDLLVRFGNVELKNYFSNYLGLKQQLEGLFKRRVDLLEEQTVKNPILKRAIERTKVLIYG